MTRVLTFGTFDLFHIGHLNIIKRAKKLGDYLIIGVSTDELNYSKKKKYPAYTEEERLEIVANIKGVDEVFYEESLALKAEYIKKYKADILVMGDDWEGRFDMFKELCKVVYLERTPNISTTKVKTEIFHQHKKHISG